jgi:hypothetical protein
MPACPPWGPAQGCNVLPGGGLRRGNAAALVPALLVLQMLQQVEAAFGSWAPPPGAPAPPPLPNPPLPDQAPVAGRLFLVDLPGASQTSVAVGEPGGKTGQGGREGAAVGGLHKLNARRSTHRAGRHPLGLAGLLRLAGVDTLLVLASPSNCITAPPPSPPPTHTHTHTHTPPPLPLPPDSPPRLRPIIPHHIQFHTLPHAPAPQASP